MAFDEKQRGLALPHHIAAEERERLSVTGVEDVESFDESSVVAVTTQGTLLIRGSGLRIGKLSLDNGELTVEGRLDGFEYEESRKSGGFWQRLFS